MISYAVHSFGLTASDAEDIVSDAFTALWQQWKEMDSHTEPILLAWFRETVKYLSYSFNRQHASRPPTVELGEWIASEGTQPTEPPPTTADP